MNLEVLRLDKEGMVPPFDKDVYEYYLTVTDDITDINVEAISENSNDIIEINGNTNLKEGLNTVEVKVMSEDRIQESIYKIQVMRTNNVELANTNLEILAIENVLLNPPFDINETNYEVEVENEVKKLNVLAIPEDENSKVEIVGTDNLKVGDNFITISVTAPNGYTTKEYQIKVYRKDQEETAEIEEVYGADRLNYDIKTTQNQYIGFWVGVIIVSIIVFAIFSILNRKKRN